MSINGLTLEDDLITPQKPKVNQLLKQNDDPQMKQQIEQIDHLDLTDESKDCDSDSGVSSLRQSRSKVATSVSRTNLSEDDDLADEEQLRNREASFAETDDQDRRLSDYSGITNCTVNKAPNDVQLNSKTSSRSSGINLPPIISTKFSTNSKQISSASSTTSTVPPNLVDRKEKHGVKQLIRKIFKPSTSVTKSSGNLRTAAADPPNSPGLNIDYVRRTAYPPMSPLPITQGPIRLLVLRHGERLDRYYSSQWLRQAFDKEGNFCRFSPILPETLPFRQSIRDFDLDPPLTYKGLKDSYHTGTVLKDKNIHINYCYTSPALRCVQTAAKILEGLQLHNKLKLRIEPGLFECTGWYTTNETSNILTMPRFMTKKELLENKYSIDKNYHEQMTIAEISQLENELEFYQRSHAVAARILQMHEHEYISQIQQGQTTANQHLHILFIAHAPNLETCTRKLCGGKFRPDSLPHVIRNVDFLTMTVIEKTDNNSDKWIFRRSSFYGDEF